MAKQNLTQDKELLAKSFLSFKSAPAMTKFLDDLLTEQEITDLAQRLRIAKGIVQDKTYVEVSEKVDASTSTVTKVG
jgi:TrpR-related protein YerC/YecD